MGHAPQPRQKKFKVRRWKLRWSRPPGTSGAYRGARRRRCCSAPVSAPRRMSGSWPHERHGLMRSCAGVEDGVFLVRESSQAGNFVLSVRTGGAVQHCQITVRPFPRVQPSLRRPLTFRATRRRPQRVPAAAPTQRAPASPVTTPVHAQATRSSPAPSSAPSKSWSTTASSRGSPLAQRRCALCCRAPRLRCPQGRGTHGRASTADARSTATAPRAPRATAPTMAVPMVRCARARWRAGLHQLIRAAPKVPRRCWGTRAQGAGNNSRTSSPRRDTRSTAATRVGRLPASRLRRCRCPPQSAAHQPPPADGVCAQETTAAYACIACGGAFGDGAELQAHVATCRVEGSVGAPLQYWGCQECQAINAPYKAVCNRCPSPNPPCRALG